MSLQEAWQKKQQCEESASPAEPEAKKLKVRVSHDSEDGREVCTKQELPEEHSTPMPGVSEAAHAMADNNVEEEVAAAKASPCPLALPDGVAAAKFASRKDRAQKWAEYVRSLNPATVRMGRTMKCPEEILLKMVGCHERSYYFQIWMHNNCNWGDVVVFEEHLREQRAGRHTTKAWLTEDQMVDVFKNPDVVSELIRVYSQESKRNRPHPDIPHVLKARQFLCTVADEFRESLENVLRKGARLEVDAEGEAGKMLCQQIMQRSADAFAEPNVLPIHDGDTKPHTDPPAIKDKDTLDLEKFRKIEEEKKRKAHEKAEEKLKKQQERRAQKAQDKLTQQQFAETPEGRARAWLKGLGDHIAKCESEAGKLKSKNLKMPASIASEYCTLWTACATKFRKTKNVIQKAVDGDQLHDFEGKLAAAQADVENFEQDMKKYRSLWRSYEKK